MEKKKKIGKILYQARKKRKLTQQEFVKNIISVSQYSRVEQGKQDIRTTDFLRIININKINLNEISDLLNENKITFQDSDDEILSQLADAFYNRDLKFIKETKEKYLLKKKHADIILQATLMEYYLENKLEKLDSLVIEKLSRKLNDEDNWTTNKIFLQLLGSSMMIFSMARLNIYMKKILKTYVDKISEYSFEIQRRIGAICINYLVRAYQDKDTQLLRQIFKLLKNISANPDLLMYKLLGKYFESLFMNNKSQSDEILKVLSLSGYENIIHNLPI